MEQFRTIVKVAPSAHQIQQNHAILTLGSCFSDAIGSRLTDNKFLTISNPFGVIYNPVSIHKALSHALMPRQLDADSFVQYQDVFVNYDFHSAFSSLSRNELEEDIEQAIDITHTFVKSVDWIILTYGTAWIYSRKDTSEIVANCHKMPAKYFNKSLLDSDSIVKSFEEIYWTLRDINSKARFILTVSPVRHTKDTLQLNSLSKSILRIACHSISEKFVDVDYFPAYEIMNDDLRDYRFYKADMIHPTEQAEEYIWQRFSTSYMSEHTLEFLKEWKEIKNALSHKPFHPHSHGHQIFLKQTIQRLEQLKNIVNVDVEMKALKSQLGIDSHNPLAHDH